MIDRVRRTFQVSAGLALIGCLAGAWAAAGTPFDRAGFEATQRSGSPMLVEIYADWCSTCRAQDRVVSTLLQEPRFRGLKVLRVDFDSQKDVVRQFGARDRSTLIVYKKGKEVGRSLGETDRQAIADLLAKAL